MVLLPTARSLRLLSGHVLRYHLMVASTVVVLIGRISVLSLLIRPALTPDVVLIALHILDAKVKGGGAGNVTVVEARQLKLTSPLRQPSQLNPRLLQNRNISRMRTDYP